MVFGDLQRDPPPVLGGPVAGVVDLDGFVGEADIGKRLPSEAPPVLTPAEREKLKAQAEADGQAAVGSGRSGANGNQEGTR